VQRLVVEALHLDLIRTFGGRPGLRDENALEAALARPRQRLAYEPDADLPTLAALYAHGLASSHPFIDGNKRIAFLTMGVFLGLNGIDLTATEAEALTVMLSLASGGLDADRFAAWLRTKVAPRPTAH
jgi:death on curing protein